MSFHGLQTPFEAHAFLAQQGHDVMEPGGWLGLPKNRPGGGVGADNEIATGHHRRLDSGGFHHTAIDVENGDGFVDRQAYVGV